VLEHRCTLTGGGVPPGLDLAQANWFYQNVFFPPASVAPQWNGDVAAGDAGTLGPDYLAAITARINAYRWMAGLPGGTTLDPNENAENQQDALMSAANQELSHDPPSSWIDYTAAGADAAGHSDLALGTSGTSAIDLFMVDPGDNNTIVGHRRWILYPPTQTMGVGDIPDQSDSLWVIQPQLTPVPDVDTIAWPPAGFVPDLLIPDRWSVQAPYGPNFSNATVTVTENGVPQQVDILSNSGGDYGGQAIVWDMPDATPPGSGQQVVYNVQIANAVIDGQSQSISYTTTAFDPTTTTELTPVPARVGFVESSEVVNWTDGTVSIDVARSMNSDQQVSVDYATADGTALAGTNYAATSGVLTFAPGQFYGQIMVPTLAGSSAHPGGTFSITLSSPTNATVSPISQTQVTISTTPPPLEFDAPQLVPADESPIGDGVTDDVTPAFSGTAEADATIRLVNGTQVIGTTTSDDNGNYTVSVQNALAPGNYSLSVFATDGTGATAASLPVSVTMVAPPATPSAPTLLPADDSGTKGDGITDDASPSLTGTASAGAMVQLLNAQDDVIGTTTADGSGKYVIAIPGSPLAPGNYPYSVETVDQYGDASNPSAPYSLTIVGPPTAPAGPVLQGGGTTVTSVHPVLTGTTVPGATVVLLGTAGKVPTAAKASSTGTYAIPIPGPVSPGVRFYRVAVIDQYGDVSSPSAPIATTVPPLVTVKSAQIEPIAAGTGKTSQTEAVVVIDFSGALNAAAADNPDAYRIAPFVTVRRGRKTISTLGPALPPASAAYDAATGSVTFTPQGVLSVGQSAELTVIAAELTDTLGRPMDGNRKSGGNYVAILSQRGATVISVVLAQAQIRSAPSPAAVDMLFARGEPGNASRSRLDFTDDSRPMWNYAPKSATMCEIASICPPDSIP